MRAVYLKLLVLAFGLLLVSLLHFSTATEGPQAHALHIFFRKLYLIPIVAGAVWFGLQGALLTALATIFAYSVHVAQDWPAGHAEWMNQWGEIGSFLIVAVVSGILVTLEQRARARAECIQTTAERERIGTAVAALTETLGARDPDTRNHSKRVAETAKDFAAFLGLSHKEQQDVYLAGILHDIGKIGIRDDVLLKPDSLTEDERRKIMEHPTIAEHILGPLGFKEVVQYVACHHEHVDGSGYPKGLCGEEIPFQAKILSEKQLLPHSY